MKWARFPNNVYVLLLASPGHVTLPSQHASDGEHLGGLGSTLINDRPLTGGRAGKLVIAVTENSKGDYSVETIGPRRSASSCTPKLFALTQRSRRL